jgi:MscS family membrane protein
MARPFFETHLPEPLLREGPRGLLWWQWTALPLAVFVSYVVGRFLGRLTRSLLRRVFARTKNTWDDLLLERLAAPITWMWAIGVAYLLFPWLAFRAEARGFINQVLHAGTYVVFFWAGLRSVDTAFQLLLASPWARAHGFVAAVVPVGTKIAKVTVVAMGIIAVLTQLGYPVASLLAGLGIGGLAVALAAQKTVENLFGSVSLGVDQPFRVGDFVRVDGGAIAGNVEVVGLRSTRVRTLERTMVSIPNGKLADMRIETFAARDRMRFYTVLNLVYGTTAAQLRSVLASIEKLLLDQPKVAAKDVSVRFVALGASSLDVEVVAMFDTADWSEFTRIRQDLLLGLMDAVERAGSGFAFPTQTVHLETKEGPVLGPGPRDGGADRDRTDDL